MKRLALLSLVILSITLICTPKAEAGTIASPSASINVSGTVAGISPVTGEPMTLSITGYIAPFASVVLSATDGTLMRTATADKDGYFTISGVSINAGFSGFCLTAVDFKKLGESYTCVTFPAATDSITKEDLFLPPTLGLERVQITVGTSAKARGYGMPGATIILNLSNGKTLTTTAGADGYFEFTIADLPAGEYVLLAESKLNGKDSLEPQKGVTLITLSSGDQAKETIKDWWKKLWDLLTSIGLGPLWLAIPILILIIILLLRLFPERFTSIKKRLGHLFGRKKPKHPLHHWWFLGY